MPELLPFIQANVLLVGVLAVLLALTVGVEVQRLTKSYRDVSPDEAVNLINRENAVVLDLREDSEAADRTILNARHVPFSALSQRLDELKALKDVPLVAFCANGLKAPGACRLLKKRDFSKVYHLKGGLAAWEQANKPLVKKR